MWDIKKVVSKGQYNYAIVPEHPFANKSGYVLEHRIIMENELGYIIPPGYVVHHINENKKDNRIENLQLMTTKEHNTLHGLSQGKKYVTLKCPSCGAIFEREKRNSHLQKGSRYTCCSMKCRGTFSSKLQYHGESAEDRKKIKENLIKEYTKYL